MKNVRLLNLAVPIATMWAGSVSVNAYAANCSNTGNGVNECIYYTNADGTGIEGQATGATGYGVQGQAMSVGVSGYSGANDGVAGTSGVTAPTGNPGVGVGNGVSGSAKGGWPAAGVFGTSTAATEGTGVIGSATGEYSTGVWGQGEDVGVGGASSGANGTGVQGSCSGSCSTSGGYAVYASGKAGGTTNWNGASDLRLKKDITNSVYGLAEILKLRSVTYKLKEGDDRAHLGFIAQEVQPVIPEVVSPSNKNGMLGIEYGSLVPVLAKAIQEQQKLIERQQARLAALEQHHGPTLSYLQLLPGGALALGLVPLGFFAGRQRRSNRFAAR
jgi:hypothetical protein